MIINCTNHIATKEQLELGVVEPYEKEEIQKLLTFDSLDSVFSANERAKEIVEIIKRSGYNHALIGGIPFFMSILENEFYRNGIIPVYAFSKRISIEKMDESGLVLKKSIFVNEGLFCKYEDGALKLICENKNNNKSLA